MNKIITLFFTLSIASQAHASEAIIIGGFMPDYAQWETGYYVTVSHIDGKAIKGAYIKSKKQEVKISNGSHTIKVNCAFEVEPKTSLAGQKELTLMFNSNNTYKLSATINFDKDKEVRRKKTEDRRKKGITKRPEYCEPSIEELEANKSLSRIGADTAPPG